MQKSIERRIKGEIGGDDPLAEYMENHGGLTSGQLRIVNSALHQRLRRRGLLKYVPVGRVEKRSNNITQQEEFELENRVLEHRERLVLRIIQELEPRTEEGDIQATIFYLQSNGEIPEFYEFLPGFVVKFSTELSSDIRYLGNTLHVMQTDKIKHHTPYTVTEKGRKEALQGEMHFLEELKGKDVFS
ncbi:MAG: hypothetical protein AABX59_00265, partial [Nanoarchaeota archaeon]